MSEFLKNERLSYRGREKGNVVNVSYELPKSFIVCKENGKIMVYISQLSSKTLYKRNKEGTYKILQSEIN